MNGGGQIRPEKREDILHIDSDIPLLGERVICRKNNWDLDLDGINLTNGLTGVVTKPASVEQFDGKQYYMDFKPDLLIISVVADNIPGLVDLATEN